jgi:triosephosphate isomerase (TIM)
MNLSMKETQMRIPLIAGNWKMNTTVTEAVNLVKELKTGLNKPSPAEVLVCPPFISLTAVKETLAGSQIKIGAQNLFYAEKGAYTGEISPVMLSGLCHYVIIGHSERRTLFHETDEIVSQKVKAAIKNGLKPILCVGENLNQYEEDKTQEVVTRQINDSLKGVDSIDTLTVAYEPIWAIGTGRAATGPLANQTIKLIRNLLARQYGQPAAEKVRILYGGSVTAGNIAEFIGQTDIDGGLVGGASLKASEFLSIIQTAVQIRHLG